MGGEGPRCPDRALRRKELVWCARYTAQVTYPSALSGGWGGSGPRDFTLRASDLRICANKMETHGNRKRASGRGGCGSPDLQRGLGLDPSSRFVYWGPSLGPLPLA